MLGKEQILPLKNSKGYAELLLSLRICRSVSQFSLRTCKDRVTAT